MLNYLYGMLEIRTRIQVVAGGFDPTRGILHGDGASGRDAYVFDLMESGRPSIERRVLKILSERALRGCDVEVSSTGICRLNPEIFRLLCTNSG